jgi:Tol biopolymer transport system component
MWIAYYGRDKPSSLAPSVGLMRANGTQSRLIVSLPYGHVECPAWAPDSRRFVIIESASFPNQSPIPPSHVRVFSVDGSQTQSFDAFAINVSFSPNGDKLLLGEYEYENGFIHRISVSNVDGSERKVLVTLGTYLKPAWDPSGTKIVYPCGGICTIQRDGTGQRQITATRADEPTYSSDGARIAFSCTTPTPVCVIDADGQNLVRLPGGSQGYTSASWSPDNKFVAYRCDLHAVGSYEPHFHRTRGSQPTTQPDICLAPADGSSIQNLTKTPSAEYSPVYAPKS